MNEKRRWWIDGDAIRFRDEADRDAIWRQMQRVLSMMTAAEMDDLHTRRHRWTATVIYRRDDGVLPVEHDLAELWELHQLVENGPNWNTIAEIRVVRPSVEGATLEEKK
jgi:hypothetical protein